MALLVYGGSNGDIDAVMNMALRFGLTARYVKIKPRDVLLREVIWLPSSDFVDQRAVGDLCDMEAKDAWRKFSDWGLSDRFGRFLNYVLKHGLAWPEMTDDHKLEEVLSLQTTAVLRYNGVEHFRVLTLMSEEDVSSLYRIGPRRLGEIRNALKKEGLQLAIPA